MTSINPNDAAARRSAAGLDPVHPAPATAMAADTTRTGTSTAKTGETGQTAKTKRGGQDKATKRGRERAPGGTAERRPADAYGTPAVLDHRVVALEVGQGRRPLIVHMADGDRDVRPLEAHVWARAGRLTVVSEEGTEMRFTVLCSDECGGLHLGERWPAGESESRTRRMAAAAMRDVGDVLTFPAWLARTTRLSGERNATMHGLVRLLRGASPETAVFVGQTAGFEHHRPEHHHPYDHRGIVGREGYPKEL